MVTDEFTKEVLAIEVDGRIRSGRVTHVLARLVSERGAPAICVRTTVWISSVAAVDRGGKDRDGVDRAGKALAESRVRELQCEVPTFSA